MPAPTFVSATTVGDYDSNTSPKTSANISVQAGDVVVVKSAAENAGDNVALAISGGVGIIDTWNEEVQAGTDDVDFCYARGWSANVDSTSSTLQVTITRSAGSNDPTFSAIVEVWRGSDGIGNTAIENDDGQPSEALTTSGANSAISPWFADWNAQGGTQTGTSSAGTPTAETSYPGDSATYGVFNFYVDDAGAAGSKTVGMSAPTSQSARGGLIEVLGSAAAGGSVPLYLYHARHHNKSA